MERASTAGARGILFVALACLCAAACGDCSASRATELDGGKRDGDGRTRNGGPGKHDGGPSTVRDAGRADGGSADAGSADGGEDASADAAPASANGTCLSYEEGWIDVTPGPDAHYTSAKPWGVTSIGNPLVSLVWNTSKPGLYAIQVDGENLAIGPGVSLVAGRCDGEPIDVPSNVYTHGDLADDELALRPALGSQYTLVILGTVSRRSLKPTRVRVNITRVCDREDDSDCVSRVPAGGLACGVQAPPNNNGDVACDQRQAPGDVDPRCPDTTYGPSNERVEGCCRPDGVCGHIDPVLGCHLRAQEFWPYWPESLQFFCDDRAAPNPPDFYQCAADGAPCQNALDCCAHYNYGNASCIDGLCVRSEG